ncbi:hypothetical protein KBC79_06045 [Candidatus Woesebacteria bacterium]|nr:hypothetical protein [Candidatus Woesebacteria bacterium]
MSVILVKPNCQVSLMPPMQIKPGLHDLLLINEEQGEKPAPEGACTLVVYDFIGPGLLNFGVAQLSAAQNDGFRQMTFSEGLDEFTVSVKVGPAVVKEEIEVELKNGQRHVIGRFLRFEPIEEKNN